jgi:hypothetical protein
VKGVDLDKQEKLEAIHYWYMLRGVFAFGMACGLILVGVILWNWLLVIPTVVALLFFCVANALLAVHEKNRVENG